MLLFEKTQTERCEARQRTEKGGNEKKRRTGRRSGWAGLVDEGDALVDEVEVAGWQDGLAAR